MTSSTTRAFMAKKPFATASAFMAKTNQLFSTITSLRLLLVMFVALTVTTNAWGADYTLVTSNTNLNNGDKVIIATKNSSGKPNTGVTGQNGNKDATVSTTEDEWVQYIVGSASTSGWTLYDSGQDKYIAKPTDNHFKYGTTAGTCFVNNNGVLGCNSRYLQANGTNYRMYSSINNSYTPFYVWKVSASYTVTATSNNNNYGTVSVSGTTITASPKTGYTYANPAYTVTYGTAIVTQNGNTFTVSPSTNCTVRINFEAKPKYTVTLKDDDSELTQSTAGGSVDLPSREGCDGYTFAGWTNSWKAPQTSWTTTAPDIISAGSYTPTADEALYPVYTKIEGGGSTEYVLTDISTIVPGDVFILADANNYALTNNNETSSAVGVKSITVSNDKVISTVDATIKWQLTGNNTDGYTFYPGSGTATWLYCNTTANSGSNNNMRVGTGNRKLFVVNKNGYLVTNDTYTARYLSRYDENSTPKDFRGYVNTNTNPVKPKLYKETSGSTTSYISVPECSTQPAVLEELQIKTPPTKTKYIEGETFDPTGAKVIAVYHDDTSKELESNEVTWSLTPLTAGKNQEITASYTEDETTVTATTQIDVYSVTLQAEDEDGNEIDGDPAAPTRNGRTITPAGDANKYVFKEWSIENATLDNSNTTKTNTITAPTDNVTVTAIYYKPITISYWSNNLFYGSQTYSYGASLSFINNPPDAPSTCSEKVFVGWVKEDQKDYRSDDTAPTYVTAGTQVESPATYYAVFADLKTVNATVDILDYADKNNWNNDTKYTTIEIDSKITATATGTSNTGKYYSTGNNWRFYQTESAKLTIAAETGCRLKTIQIEYYDNNTKGVLKYNGNNITSNDIVEVNAQLITFTVGSTSQDVTNGQVRVASISVTYVVEGEYENFVTSCEQTYTLTNVVAPSNEYGRVEPLQVTYIPSGATTSISNDTYTVNGTTVTAIPAAATAQYTYAFSNWSNLPATVTADATVTANFTRTINKYTITWKNGDDILETDTDMEYGATPTYNGATPTKEQDEIYTYEFTGWTPEIADVTGDQIYTATYNQIKRQYTVIWFVNGRQVHTEQVDAGNEITPPDVNPIPCGAVFAGWTTAEMAETSNVAPTLYPNPNPFPVASSNITYYAVFADYDEQQ